MIYFLTGHSKRTQIDDYVAVIERLFPSEHIERIDQVPAAIESVSNPTPYPTMHIIDLAMPRGYSTDSAAGALIQHVYYQTGAMLVELARKSHPKALTVVYVSGQIIPEITKWTQKLGNTLVCSLSNMDPESFGQQVRNFVNI